MNPTEIVLAACDLGGVRLSVTKDAWIDYRPRSAMPAELLAEIKANREDLVFIVLLSDALRYVAVEHHVEGADPGSVLDVHEDTIDAAHHAGDRPAFRAAIRAFARAGRREAERAWQAIGEASGSLEALGETQGDAVLPGVRDRRASDFGVLSRRREHGVREHAGAGSAPRGSG